MSKSNLSPPIIEDNATRTAINQLYLQVNNLLTSISPNAQNYSNEALEGSVRAIYEGNDSYRIEGKTSAGWASITAQAQGKGNLYNNSPKIDSNGRLNVNNIIYGKNNLELHSGKDLKIKSVGDIELNSDGGQITIKDGAASHFLFDCDATKLRIYDDTTESDFFDITVGANGATTISTNDNDGLAGTLTLDADGAIVLDADGGAFTFFNAGDADDFMRISVGANGATSIATIDSDGAVGHLTLAPDGDVIVSGANLQIDATEKISLDGGGDTYIVEAAADEVRYYVGNDRLIIMVNNGADGNQVHFQDSSAGFTQLEPTYNASATDVDFRHSNKQNLTFGAGSITNINLYFPTMSGNFQLLLKQDGTGSRTITNYKVYEFDESLADGEAAVKWAGGSNPTLTTDANHVDILSFYWDADNEIAYGVATLDFQF